MRLSRGLHEKDATIGSLLRETFRDGIVENAGGNDLIAADAGSWPYTCWELFVLLPAALSRRIVRAARQGPPEWARLLRLCKDSRQGPPEWARLLRLCKDSPTLKPRASKTHPVHPRILKLQPHFAARAPEEGSPAHFPGHYPLSLKRSQRERPWIATMSKTVHKERCFPRKA